MAAPCVCFLSGAVRHPGVCRRCRGLPPPPASACRAPRPNRESVSCTLIPKTPSLRFPASPRPQHKCRPAAFPPSQTRFRKHCLRACRRSAPAVPVKGRPKAGCPKPPRARPLSLRPSLSRPPAVGHLASRWRLVALTNRRLREADACKLQDHPRSADASYFPSPWVVCCPPAFLPCRKGGALLRVQDLNPKPQAGGFPGGASWRGPGPRGPYCPPGDLAPGMHHRKIEGGLHGL